MKLIKRIKREIRYLGDKFMKRLYARQNVMMHLQAKALLMNNFGGVIYNQFVMWNLKCFHSGEKMELYNG